MGSNSDWTSAFIVTADIDASSIGSPSPIGSLASNFSGSFDGNNHTISNLTINTPAALVGGLFGYVQGATISNIILSNCTIVANQTSGGLCGQNTNGIITNCHTTGSVEVRYEFVGGLVGFNNNGTITNSSSSCTVKSNKTDSASSDQPRIAGGFVGVNAYNGSISNCHVTGDVSVGAFPPGRPQAALLAATECTTIIRE